MFGRDVVANWTVCVLRVCKNDVLTATGELEEAVLAGEVRVD